MSHFYTRNSVEKSPVCLDDMKRYLKNPPSTDDDLIQIMIDSATEYGELYTGRAFRVQAWTVLIDAFLSRIALSRDPVDAITSIKYLVSGSQVTVSGSVYYLKKSVQCSEILLSDGQDWPTDIDNIEHGVEIVFSMIAYRNINQIKEALYRHIAFLYANRGDCNEGDAGKDSGANAIYDQFTIVRV